MSKELAVYDEMPLMEVGDVLVKSKYFADASDVSKAAVKILAGREMGFGPIASMTGIHIIKGKPSVGANLMAAAVKRDPRYNYRVVKLTDEVCELVFFENGEKCGNSIFTKEQAQKAGTQNMNKFPRNMLFARAMSNGVKWHCPDIMSGAPIYTPEELGAEVNEDGEVINGAYTVEETPSPQPPDDYFDRYYQLCEEALELGIEAADLPDRVTVDEIVEMGKALKAQINAATVPEKTWPAAAIAEILAEGLANHANHAINTLNLSDRLTPEMPHETIVGWAKIYRDQRNAGNGSLESQFEADDWLMSDSK